MNIHDKALTDDGYIGEIIDINKDLHKVELKIGIEHRWFNFNEIKILHKAIPYEDTLRFVEHIQRIKDIYNDGNKEILNYGMLCDLCIEGWNLVK